MHSFDLHRYIYGYPYAQVENVCWGRRPYYVERKARKLVPDRAVTLDWGKDFMGGRGAEVPRPKSCFTFET